ncbi:MAG: ATP-grasp domain-containing protein [Pirellulaceae bacterium]
MSVRLFIAGASARAAAQSAVRSGLNVTAADMFCDDDLAACCAAALVSDYPEGILQVAERIPPAEWMYTGGVENEPELVDAVSRRHKLLGHAGSVLRQVRDPRKLAKVLTRAKLLCPHPRHTPPEAGTGRWLVKPRRGCGGLRIHEYDPRAAACPRGWYLQPWVRGVSLSAVYLAAGSSAVLLGVTRQLVGCRWAGAHGFHYVGSIGPLAINDQTHREFQRIGDCLTHEFQLCGLFGIDTIVSGTDVWTIEVNPRFTASVEILELATGLAAVGLHRDACLGTSLPAPGRGDSGPLFGKAIICATRDCVIDAGFYQRLDALERHDRFGRFADLPRIGSPIRAGHPVLTTFALGHRLQDVYRELRVNARVLHEILSHCEAREDLSPELPR